MCTSCMNDVTSDPTQYVELIQHHGTIEEQLPTPRDGTVKVLSEELRSFVESHPQYTLEEISFSLFGQIETEYITSIEVLEDFDKPQATVETINGEQTPVVHYTTSVA